VQISDSQILNPKMVNETRFQFQRENTHQLPFSTATAIQVQGDFTGGGSSQGDVRTTQNNYELQNYTSIAHGKHFAVLALEAERIEIDKEATPAYLMFALFTGTLGRALVEGWYER